MGRFSPTVLPRPSSGLSSALDRLVAGFQSQRDRRRRDEREDELDERYDREFDFRRERAKTTDERYAEDAARRGRRDTVDLHERGYREGEAPPSFERRAPGYDLGTAPGGMAEGDRSADLMHRHGGFGGGGRDLADRSLPDNRPGGFRRGPDATLGGEGGPLAAHLGGLAREGRPAEPELVALPGAFVPGHPQGFTDQAIFRRRERTPLNRYEARPDPRYEQVTDDLYRDRTATPEARRAASEESERRREVAAEEAERRRGAEETAAERREQASVLAALEHISPEQARALAHGAPASAVLPRERAADRPSYQRFEGEGGDVMSFDPRTGSARPVTGPDGEPVRGSGAEGGVSPTQLAVAERQRVLNAARDVSRIDRSDYWTSGGPQIYQRHVQRILGLYGFDSLEELGDRMRSFGIRTGEAQDRGGGEIEPREPVRPTPPREPLEPSPATRGGPARPRTFSDRLAGYARSGIEALTSDDEEDAERPPALDTRHFGPPIGQGPGPERVPGRTRIDQLRLQGHGTAAIRAAMGREGYDFDRVPDPAERPGFRERATQLRSEGLTDDQIIEQLREEGYVQ